MNKTETKQLLDYVKRLDTELREAWDSRKLPACVLSAEAVLQLQSAIAICEADLARVDEPVEEQQVFEDWLARVCPSGDVESVQAQWLASWDYREWCEDLAEATPQEAVAQPADGFVLMPIEPTHEIISAMACSKARDDEGEFPALMDHIDYSGESKTHTVLKAAYRAAINAKVSS